ncbi:MAG: hypothetical protein B7Y02_08115, partial [Rhodobacterales bacterium 17-64-5]
MRTPHLWTSCLLALAAVLAPLQTRADTVLATSHITAVTLYPEGARITREVTFTAAPGPHEVLITDLPAAVEPTMIRLASPDAALGAFALRTDRLPPRAEPTTPARDAAKAAVKTAEAALAEAQAAVAAINAQVEAQEAQITFLTKLRLDAAGATADSLTAIAQMVQTRVLAARQAAQLAEAGLPAAKDGVTRASDALSQAQAALGALSKGDADYVALSVALTSTGQTTHLTVTHYTADATWAPVYDMALDRKTPTLTVERGVLVSQYTGEDWAGVDLTLSTAQPSSQSEPSPLYPELKSIGDPEPMAKSAGAAEGMADAVMSPAPVVESRVTAAMSYQGDTVVYHYPAAVDVADGVENLRLALDTLTFTPQVQARAVPRHDATAFLVARLTNTGTEILLPGTAYLTRDGVLTGATQLASLAPGAETTLGFGAIEGLKLTRDMPKKAEGDRGIFST